MQLCLLAVSDRPLKAKLKCPGGGLQYQAGICDVIKMGQKVMTGSPVVHLSYAVCDPHILCMMAAQT